MLDSPEIQPIDFADDELDRMLARVKQRSGEFRSRRRRHRNLATGLLAFLLAGIGATVGLQLSAHQSQAPPSTARGSVSAPKWRLVGDISPAWQTLAGLGYEPSYLLSCPSLTTCYAEDLRKGPGAIGGIEVTYDAGSTWQQSNLPVTLSAGTAISCATAETCATLGIDGSGKASFLKTTDGGQSWTVTAGPGGLTSSTGITDLACITAESCVVVASNPAGQTGSSSGFVTSDGGTTWQLSDLPAGFVPIDLRCPSQQRCVVSGFYQSPEGGLTGPVASVLYSTDGGSTWSASSFPAGLGPFSSLDCGNASDCVAAFFGGSGSSSEVLGSTDGGQSWTPAGAAGLPSGLVTGLSCTTGLACWASGVSVASSGGANNVDLSLSKAAGLLAVTDDGGQNWQEADLPGKVAAAVDISCPTSTVCFALALERSTSGGPATFVLLSNKS